MDWIGLGLFWLIAMVVLLGVEAVTVGLTSLWFAAGALAALLVSFWTENIWIQLSCFLAVAFLTLFFVRPVVMKRFVRPQRQATNVDRVLGAEGVVLQTIDNVAAQGQVKVLGGVWTARSTGESIPVNTVVRVERIEGVKLIVAPLICGAEKEK
ncbi:MAG: NfeD family protein [Oscillospiraceae bacterium]|nr:NfeD family protein [Oscillospiraceae bacterium]